MEAPIPAEMLSLYNEVMGAGGPAGPQRGAQINAQQGVKTGRKHFDQSQPEWPGFRKRLGWLKGKEIAFLQLRSRSPGALRPQRVLEAVDDRFALKKPAGWWNRLRIQASAGAFLAELRKWKAPSPMGRKLMGGCFTLSLKASCRA